jgi:S1-C subfamily serine protease
MQNLYTIGAPKHIELGQTITRGIFSNERIVNNNHLLQLNMNVNSGNSGGPVIDNNQKLHGVIVSKLWGLSVEGICFAIPSHIIKDNLNLK